MGAAEEAAAGEVTDRMSSFISLWTFSSASPTRRGPTIVMLLFLLFVCFSCSETGPVDPLKVEVFQNFALPHFKNTKIGKSTASPPLAPFPVTKEHVVFERPHLNATDQVNFLFLLLLFLVNVPPLSSSCLGSRNVPHRCASPNSSRCFSDQPRPAPV